jgi:hypothetical protein
VVEAYATSVGGKDEKEVKALLVMGEGGKETVAKKAMGQEGEGLTVDAAESVG